MRQAPKLTQDSVRGRFEVTEPYRLPAIDHLKVIGINRSRSGKPLQRHLYAGACAADQDHHVAMDYPTGEQVLCVRRRQDREQLVVGHEDQTAVTSCLGQGLIGGHLAAGGPSSDVRKIFTRGAVTEDGAGAWVWVQDSRLYTTGCVQGASLQRLQLMAVIDAMKSFRCPFNCVTDSSYIAHCFHMGWWKIWLANDWRQPKRLARTKGPSGVALPLANIDLWQELVRLHQLRRHTKINFGFSKKKVFADQLALETAELGGTIGHEWGCRSWFDLDNRSIAGEVSHVSPLSERFGTSLKRR